MPIELALADSYLFVRMHGVVTAAEMEIYGVDTEKLESQRPESLDRMTDLTEVERFDVVYRDIFQLADRRKRRPHTRNVKVAAIARQPEQIGMARMFQTLSEHPQIEVRIFDTREEALAWLGKRKDSTAASNANPTMD